MAISAAAPSPSDSDGIRDVADKETHHHQQVEHATMTMTPPMEEDPQAGKLTKETILAYIVSHQTSHRSNPNIVC